MSCSKNKIGLQWDYSVILRYLYSCECLDSCCFKCGKSWGFLYKFVEACINLHLLFSPFTQGRLGINTQ